ncbi:MAG TPA: FCD domain-containing protein, partial [Gammaproteobacteria bacterium]|nr:FCD domain-containing protein [Gammaproteobacteria bacterium]
DHELHDTVARGCANRFIGDTLIHHQRLRRLSGSPVQPNLHRLREATREHLGIINQIEGGRMEVAADLMRIHLRLAGEQRPKMAHWGAPAAFRGIGDGR